MKRARANSILDDAPISGAPISEAPPPGAAPGITLAGFNAFITSHGGRAAFEGKTTCWVKYNILLPSTDASLASFADNLAATGSAHARPASSFVSHAYDDLFLGLVDSLALLESKEASSPVSFGGPSSYYFDLLCVNQHQDWCVGKRARDFPTRA